MERNRTLVQIAANGGNEPRLADAAMNAKVRFGADRKIAIEIPAQTCRSTTLPRKSALAQGGIAL